VSDHNTLDDLVRVANSRLERCHECGGVATCLAIGVDGAWRCCDEHWRIVENAKHLVLK
jgi:hypothetical protein